MKITVLNGSPKGELSVTMQYVAYLAKLNPQHEFNILHIAQKIKQIEKDPAVFNQIIEQIHQSDAVLWGFPLYVLLVHAHYKRFIELVFERHAQAAFAGKYAAAISTSIHFFDHTAHNYIHAICDDLGMRFVDSFSPEMNDLLSGEGRCQLTQFGRSFLDAVERQIPTQRQYLPIIQHDFHYQPAQSPAQLSVDAKKIVILHDAQDLASNIAGMVSRMQSTLGDDVRVVNIHQLDMKAGCQGCLQCGAQNICAYTGKDGYIEFYKSTVMTADILIYAGAITDRFLSSRWKMFFDRIFFNTHTPVLMGKQVGLLISGPLSQTPNVMEVLRGLFEFQGANVVGVVTDECGASAELDRLIDGLAVRALDHARVGYVHPQTFLGVGGMKIFRDDIYGRLRTVFAADHRAYKRLGIYKTFPQAQLGVMLLNTFIAPLVNLRPIRAKFDRMMKKQMVQAHKQVASRAA